MSEDKMFDSKTIGPGIWYTLHILAKDCDSNHTPQIFIRILTLLVITFKCKICKLHAISYTEKNNPHDLIILKKQSCFFYINKFHNTVNLRLKKPVYSLNKSEKIYNSKCNSCDNLSDNEVTFL